MELVGNEDDESRSPMNFSSWVVHMDCELHGYRNQLFMDKGRKADGITLISVL